MNITRGGGGLIRSPNAPLKYLLNTMCEWHIYAAHSNSKILIQFMMFAMEGNQAEKGELHIHIYVKLAFLCFSRT